MEVGSWISQSFFDGGANARAHFAGGLVGEGDRDERTERIAFFEQVEIAPDEHARLTRAGAGGDSYRRAAASDRLLLPTGELELREDRGMAQRKECTSVWLGRISPAKPDCRAVAREAFRRRHRLKAPRADVAHVRRNVLRGHLECSLDAAFVRLQL